MVGAGARWSRKQGQWNSPLRFPRPGELQEDGGVLWLKMQQRLKRRFFGLGVWGGEGNQCQVGDGRTASVDD